MTWFRKVGQPYEKIYADHFTQFATCRLWGGCCAGSNANTNTREWHMQSRALLTGRHNTNTRNAYCYSYSNATSCYAWKPTNRWAAQSLLWQVWKAVSPYW